MNGEHALAQLRHLYAQMLSGNVKDCETAAHGLLGPAIEALEVERRHIAALEKARLQRQADLCEIHKVLMWAGEWDLNLPPPSRAVVALLEEHRNALVRAKKEGLEEVAKLAAANWDDGEGIAASIRAMKEPESD